MSRDDESVQPINGSSESSINYRTLHDDIGQLFENQEGKKMFFYGIESGKLSGFFNRGKTCRNSVAKKSLRLLGAKSRHYHV